MSHCMAPGDPLQGSIRTERKCRHLRETREQEGQPAQKRADADRGAGRDPGSVGRSVWLEAGRKLEQVRVGATQALGGSWRDL